MVHTTKLLSAICMAAALSRTNAALRDSSTHEQGSFRGIRCNKIRTRGFDNAEYGTLAVRDAIRDEAEKRWKAGLCGEDFDSTKSHAAVAEKIAELDALFESHDKYWQKEVPFVSDPNYSCPRSPAHKHGKAAFEKCGEKCSMEQLIDVANKYNWVKNAKDDATVQRDVFKLRGSLDIPGEPHAELHFDRNRFNPSDHDEEHQRSKSWQQVWGDGGYPQTPLKCEPAQPPRCEDYKDGRCCMTNAAGLPVPRQGDEVCALRAAPGRDARAMQ